MDISEIISLARGFLDNGENSVTISEFFLRDDDGEEVQLSMPPEEIHVKTSATFRSFSVVEAGEIKIPKGEQLTAVSWRGTLPGAGILAYPFVVRDAWSPPVEVIKIINRWREGGKKLKLLITQTPVNLDVYIKAFDYSAKGGQGDYTYNISFVAAKPLQVRTVAEADAQTSRRENEFGLLPRNVMEPPEGKLMGYLDTAFTAAEFLTGNGGNWRSLLQKNGIVSPDYLEVATWIIH